MSFMKSNSYRCEAAGGRESAYLTLSGPNVLGLRSQAQAHGVEWHHAAGHSKGREVISFFPKNEKEREAVDRLSAIVSASKETAKAEAKQLKAAGLPTSKAALWRHLAKHGQVDAGFGSVEYKEGKYGPFVPSFGEADGRYYFDSEALADVAKKLLKL